MTQIFPLFPLFPPFPLFPSSVAWKEMQLSAEVKYETARLLECPGYRRHLMHGPILNYFNDNLRWQKADASNSHERSDGAPRAYEPTLTLSELRKARPVQGEREPRSKPEWSFQSSQRSNAQSSYRQVPLFAIKQGAVIAADLGMKSFRATCSRLHRAAVAILERQVELETWVNEQAALLDDTVKLHCEDVIALETRKKALKIKA